MKKGFTIVELLTIIAILGLLITLLVPNVVGIVERSENKTFLQDAKSIIRASENFFSQSEDTYSEGDCFDITENLEMDLLDNINSGKICYINSEPYLKHISNGNKCISGSNDNLEIYKCGTKVNVFFDGSLLAKNNNPYIDVPFYTLLIDRNSILNLEKYNNVYTEYNTENSYNSYNFWHNHNMQHVPIGWIDDNSNQVDFSQKINRDTIFKVNTILKVHDSQPIYSGLRSGDYEISMAIDDSLKLGYTSLEAGINYVTIAINGLWTLKNYGDYYKFFLYDDSIKVLDGENGTQDSGIAINIYTTNHTTQQRFKLLKTTQKDVYQIQGVQNSANCIQAETLEKGSKFRYQLCDSSNPNQLFKIKKYK